VTVAQRSKEYASDYRYFPEPDLPPLALDRRWVEEIREDLPELPREREHRFERQYGLSPYDANLLTASRATADFFEAVMDARPAAGGRRRQLAKSVGNWVLGELARLQNTTGQGMSELRIQPRHLIDLLALIDDGTLSTSMAKTVFEEMFETGAAPGEVARRSGLVQISDADLLEEAVAEAIGGNPDPVADYLKGKETAMRFLVGQVMKITKGRANPRMAGELVKAKLEALR
jgi:aspartyl-tRNA(Asn)/glutamyl-tRNA(Gln) amidotransferase subunit B